MSNRARLAVGAAALAGAGLIAAATLAGTATGQPPGNPGSVKIDFGAPGNGDPANEPHVDCPFELEFFNFPEDTYPVTFTAWPPTERPTGSQVLLTTNVVVDEDPELAGPFNLDFSGITPHPQQGFHVKVTVDTGQGAGKSKVFWVDCPRTPTPTPTKTTPTPTPTVTKTTPPPTKTTPPPNDP